MPYALRRLITGSDDDSVHFRKNIRTYNNNFAFTSLGAKYDRELTQNRRGMYTFRVQGQVYHLLNGLIPNDQPQSGIQLYFYDAEEEIVHRMNSSDKMRASVLKLLSRILEDNPYARFFRSLRYIPELENQTIVLNCNPMLDQRRYNLPSSSEVAAIFSESDSLTADRSAHIQVYTHSNTSHRIKHYYACCDPLQYPLLFPGGQSGWHHMIPKDKTHFSSKNKRNISHLDEPFDVSELANVSALIGCEEQVIDEGGKRADYVTARQYYCYKLQMRETDQSMLLHSQRLLQQYAVNAYVKIETCRLDFQRYKQKEIRSDLLRGIMDALSSGEHKGNNVGKKVILPASFIGGPRDMRRRYLDAIALVQKYGKPDIFLTMTCNPNWPEIRENLKYEEHPFDRPDLLSRVFRAKLEILKEELMKKQIFGEVAACVYVIEFQKRGMPHAHFLLILKEAFKPLGPEAYDRIICAELPDPIEHPHLYRLVVKHMVHGPCGELNTKNPCMRDGQCKSKYPKEFAECTTHAEDSYPCYRRRNNGRKVSVCGNDLDNRWVVPYNPYLLAMFDCHMNVEICSTVKLVKYMYKYIYKGHDMVSFYVVGVENDQEIDEIKDFQDGRWIGPPEALWRIYGFCLNQMRPSVYTLQVHLEGEQIVSFAREANLETLIQESDFSRTMLTEFFRMNSHDDRAKRLQLLYKDFPQHFVWNSVKKQWSERKKFEVIGRMVSANPKEGERYYLRLLLSNVTCPKSYDDLLTVNGQKCSSFREAALTLGLLHSDEYIEDTLAEAANFQMPSSLRYLFAVILVFCMPNDPYKIFSAFEDQLSSDFQRTELSSNSPERVRMKTLQSINTYLQQMGKQIKDFCLVPEDFQFEVHERVTRELYNETNIQVSEADLLLPAKMNFDQKKAYSAIMEAVYKNEAQYFFVDGPGGTGKTFLYKCLLATVRSQGHIAIAVATSGVAASILPGGRTAHSRFKIPLDFSAGKHCGISKQSSTAKLILEARLILWDEVTMAKKEAIEALDDLLRDIMDCSLPFGGKVVVFGGDFRQTLPVIEKASRDTLVRSSILHSPLWKSMKKLVLKKNMRAVLDPAFSAFLLRIGEGLEHTLENGSILLPSEIVLPYDEKDKSITRLIDHVFGDLHMFFTDPYAMINRCILCPKNNAVDDINSMLIDQFPGDQFMYKSVDKPLDERHQGDFEDFLNTLNPKGLPPHELILKKNCPLILLRNLDPIEGLCNGTRLICRDLKPNTLYVQIAVGEHKGKSFFLPRIPLHSPDNEKNAIPFSRTQFPVRLCYAMTINKAQGQTLDFVGIYLREPVFSHGQLYVALSRAKTSQQVKVMIVPPTFGETKSDRKTRNVVFPEVFRLATV